MSSPLLELIVKISLDGDKDLDKKLKAIEDRAKATDESFKQLGPDGDKSLKTLTKALEPVNEKLDAMKKSFDGFSKGLQDGQKKNVDALNNLGKSITGVQTEADKLGKTKIEMQAELQGRDVVIGGLREMKGAGEDLDGKTITITTRLSGNEEVLRGLTEVEGVEMRIDGDTAVITVRGDNIEQTVAGLEAVEFALSNVDGQTATARVDVDGVPEAVAGTSAVDEGLDNIDGRHAEAKADVDTSTASANIKRLITDLDNVGSTLGEFSRNIGLARGGVAVMAIAIGVLASAVVPLLGGLTVLGGLVTAAAAGFGILAGGAVELGIGLKAVSDASGKVTDAQTKVQAATIKLNDALASGDTEGAAKASKELETAQNSLEKAQASLTAVTNQQSSAVVTLFQKWQEFKAALPGTFEAPAASLARLGVSVLDLAEKALPAVEREAQQVGRAFEAAFNQVLETFQSDAISNALQQILDAASPVIRNLTVAVGDLGAALIQIFAQAVPFAIDLSGKIKEIAQAFLDWSTSAEGVDQITAAVEAAVPLFTELWEQLKNVGAALLEFSTQHGDEAVSAIKTIGETIVGVTEVIGAFLTAFEGVTTAIDGAGQAIFEMSPHLGDLVTGTDATKESMSALRTEVDNLPTTLYNAGLKVDELAKKFRTFVDDLKSGEYQGTIRGVVKGMFEGADEEAQTQSEAVGKAAVKGLKRTEPEFQGEATNFSSILKDKLGKEEQPTEEAAKQVGQHAGEGVASGAKEAEPKVEEEANNLGDYFKKNIPEALKEAKTLMGAVWEDIKHDAMEFRQGVEEALAPLAEWLRQKWEEIKQAASEAWQYIKENILTPIQETATETEATIDEWSAWLSAKWEEIKQAAYDAWVWIKENIITPVGEFITEVEAKIDEWVTWLSTKWEEIKQAAYDAWQWIKENIITPVGEFVTEVENKVTELASTLSQKWEDIKQSASDAWLSVKDTAIKYVTAMKTEVERIIQSLVFNVKSYMSQMTTAIDDFIAKIPGASALGFGQGPAGANPHAGAPTLRAKGGVEDNTESQGPTGGVSDGNRARVVYGEQQRKVKEAYIVEDLADNVPYLAEAASWHGYGLVKMAKGGVTTPTSGTAPTTAPDGTQLALVPVASPTPGELAPYMADAAPVQGYNPEGTPAADWTGFDHVNTPIGTVSGDPFGGQGGSVATPWPGLAVIASGGSATAWVPTKPTGPSFAMASGGTLPTSGAGSGAGSGAIPVPLSYQAVPLGTWNQFLGLQWLADPAMDFPVLYPPGEWSPDQIYSPAAMKRGGILRGGTRYFQGGGLNQAQIEAGLAAGSSILGAPYSYGMAGEDGGFDCAGVWNYIESAIAYGAPQIGKRWGTYEAAAGSTQFSIPGVTPGGANIGVDTTGWEGDGTHMAGDIQGTAFEGNLFSGVVNGMDSSGFGTQYTMGGAAEVAGMLPSDAGTAPPSTSPAPTMDSTVADWWGATAPPVPDVTGATGGGPSASAGGSQANIKMNANTGNKQSGGSGSQKSKSGNITQTKNITSSGTSGSPGTGGSGGSSGAGGGTLADGVQNFMTALPGVTQDYLQNVGQQTLGTAGQFNMPPIGNTTDDWIIAALEGMGMDPTPETIATISMLMMQESGGDPAAVSPDGATGVMQLMPETWDAYNVGGDITDPVANIMASINYQLARYGGLVDFSPYKDGGYTLKPHLGLVGEGGGEAMLPLENRSVMASLRSGLGTEGFTEAFVALSQRVDNVAERIDYQTRTMPAETGRFVKDGYDWAVERNPSTRMSFARGANSDAARRNFAGV
jgi:hypothetical protein